MEPLGLAGSSETKGTLLGTVKLGLSVFLILFALSAPAVTPQITAGQGNGFAVLDANGTVWTAGYDHAATDSSQPVAFPAITDARAVHLGYGTIWFIRSDNSLWGAGTNARGELGTGAVSSSKLTTPIKVLDGVSQVVQVVDSTYAVRTDGTLWAWGGNDQGQLGLGDRLDRAIPAQVSGLKSVRKVAGGGTHALALTDDGRVWAMGSNCCGQLGWAGSFTPDDPRFYQPSPLLIEGIDNVTDIAAANGATYMVKTDGTAWALGAGQSGQLGTGDVAGGTSVPKQLPGLSGVKSVETIGQFSLALRRDGTVWGWGNNLNGQLGGVGQATEPAPIPLSFLTNVSAIATGVGGGFALRGDGTIMSWGANGDGSLGRGKVERTLLPGLMSGPGGVGTFNATMTVPTTVNKLPTMAFQAFSSSDHIPATVTVKVSATDADGTITSINVVASDGRTSAISPSGGEATFVVNSIGTYWFDAVVSDNVGGVAVQRGSSIVVKPKAIALNVKPRIRAGGNPMVLNSRGEVRTWGPIGWIGENFAPVVPPEFLNFPHDPKIATVVDIESGGNNFAILQGGQVLAWGRDLAGELGLKSGEHVSTATVVPGLSDVVQMASGSAHTLALDKSGRVYATGQNAYGQLGLGDRSTRTTFTQLPKPASVTQIAVGSWMSYALDTAGTLWAWGRNDSGQLGDGSLSDSTIPTIVPGLPPIAEIYPASQGAFALGQDGSIWGWGGVPLPDASPISFRYLSPLKQPSLSGAKKISAYYIAAMLKSDGTVWTWGDGTSWPTLGDGKREKRNQPAMIPGLTNVTDVAMHFLYGMALKSDGSVVSWGINNSGQLGTGTVAQSLTPDRVVDESATGYLSLTGTSLDNAVDPFKILQIVGKTGTSLSTKLTDRRVQQFDGEVYFTALLPRSSPLVRLLKSRQRDSGVGMIPVAFGRSGYKQTGPALPAEANASGVVNAGNQYAVYEKSSADPLAGSNALICMGVTVASLSAKGQVIMRPIATGDATTGVVQCPTVQTEATSLIYTAQTSGPITARTITATMNPLAEHRGQTRNIYSWAVAPDGTQLMQTPAGWLLMSEPMLAAKTVQVPISGNVTLPVTKALDLSSLVGTLVYVGMGSSWEEVRDLNQAGHYYTVQ